MADAAAVTSLIARSEVRNFGSTSRPTRAATGTSSCSSPSLFRSQFSDQEIHAGRIAAWPTVAGDETKRHRVLADAEDNGDCLSCRLGRQRHKLASRRGDHVDPLAN